MTLAKSPYYILLILLFFSLYSCNTENQYHESLENYQNRKHCLSTFRQCNNEYPFVVFEDDPIGYLLNLEWLERQNECDLVISNFNVVKDQLGLLPDNSWLKKQFTRTYLVAKNNLQILNINELDSLIQIESSTNKLPTTALINYLQFKANALREKQEINFSFATSLYAEYLTNQLSDIEKPYYFPFGIHAINLYREKHETEAKFFLKKALQTNAKTPGHRWLKTLWLTIGKHLSKEETISIRSQVSDTSQYNPYVDNLIETHLLYACANPEYEVELCLREFEDIEDLCQEASIIKVSFLVDAYFKIADLENAKKYLDKMNDCPIVRSEAFSWPYNYRSIRYYYLKFKDQGNKEDLKNAYKSAVNLYESYKSRGEELINSHYADAISLINSIFIDVLYELNNEKIISDDKVINHLVETKVLYDKLSDTQSWVGSKIMNKEESKQVGRLKHEIEKREAKCKNYRDTSMITMEIYKELYQLHNKLYYLKNNLENKSSKLEFSTSNFFQEKIPINTQVIDISKTDQYYYFATITNSSLKISRFSSLEIEKEAGHLLKSIRTNTTLSESYYILNRLSKICLEDNKSTFIIPDGIFHKLPFEVLIKKESLSNINFTYASNIEKIIHNKSNFLSKEIISCSYSSQKTIEDKSVKNIPDLPLGLLECQLINKIYPKNKLIQGANLTETELLNSLNAPILHISTHSKSSSSNHLDNFLYVRDEDGNGKPIYGFSIKTKSFPNSLVILSSCDSGTGAQTSGAGVFSLSRDILQAGAQTVIKSLWPVNEKSTAELMIKFHEYLEEGKTASQALIDAKIYLSNIPQYSHPYYWSGFIVEGNGRLSLR